MESRRDDAACDSFLVLLSFASSLRDSTLRAGLLHVVPTGLCVEGRWKKFLQTWDNNDYRTLVLQSFKAQRMEL